MQQCGISVQNPTQSKWKKMQKAALRVVFYDYSAHCNQLLRISKRSPLLIVRPRALLIEVFKYVGEINPIFTNILFTLNNKPYDTRSGSLITQSHVKQSSTALIHLFIKAASNRMHYLPMPRDIEGLHVFKNYIDKWTGPHCHCGHCVLCAIKTLYKMISYFSKLMLVKYIRW